MKLVHLAIAILASFRLVELFLMDRITAKLRARHPSYIWQCSRCMSVWAGAAATIIFAIWPWLNWPLAFSWIYIVHNDWIFQRKAEKRGREFTISVAQSGEWKVARNELQEHEARSILEKIITPSVRTT